MKRYQQTQRSDKRLVYSSSKHTLSYWKCQKEISLKAHILHYYASLWHSCAWQRVNLCCPTFYQHFLPLTCSGVMLRQEQQRKSIRMSYKEVLANNEQIHDKTRIFNINYKSLRMIIIPNYSKQNGDQRQKINSM